MGRQRSHQHSRVVGTKSRNYCYAVGPCTLRAAVWSIALLWMGTACILNAQRCGRTHCRYTGPYYLAMIVPITLLASGVISANIYGWLALALFIIAGGWIIWWATERAWGKFS